MHIAYQCRKLISDVSLTIERHAPKRCTLLEFGVGADHVQLLVDIHLALNISALINGVFMQSRWQKQSVCYPRSLEGVAGDHGVNGAVEVFVVKGCRPTL